MTGLADYERYDALGLAELLRNGEVTAPELVEAAIDRIERHDPALNAVAHRLYDSARAAARTPRISGPFAGVPFLVKDLLAHVAGAPLTAGCRLLAEHRCDHDSELVVRHRRAGLLILGRTTTPEFGTLPVTESRLQGVTRNPWDGTRSPGGSSGGAAAAVSAGMVPLAHGSDGGGSIRIPAACCGLFGLKPTRGRVPLGPDLGDVLGGFVQEHAISRSVRDSAALLDATQGSDAGAPYAAPPAPDSFLAELERPPPRLRIALAPGSLFGGESHRDCVAATEDAARLCESLGHAVTPAAPPIDKAALVRALLLVYAVETRRATAAAEQVAGRRARWHDFEPQTWLLALIGGKVGGAAYADALETARLAGRQMAAFHRSHDLLLTPTLAQPPPPLGAFVPSPGETLAIAALRRLPLAALLESLLDRLAGAVVQATGNTMLFNMTGQPAASLPLHWTDGGLPIGVQLAAPFGADSLLLRLARQLEEARPWFDRRPPLATG